MKKFIKAIVKHPGKAPEMCTLGNDLKVFENIIQGYIEPVMVEEDLIVICDEEGRINGKPFNCWFDGISFLGTIIAVGEGYGDVPISLEGFEDLME